jgi:hypothetical protein
MKRGISIGGIGAIIIALLAYFVGVYPFLSPTINEFVTTDPFLGFLISLVPLAFIAGIFEWARSGINI